LTLATGPGEINWLIGWVLDTIEATVLLTLQPH
jgi:hypothetical protein